MNKQTNVYYDLMQTVTLMIVFICSAILCYYYITTEVDSCTSDPLMYGAEKVAKQENFTLDDSYIYFAIYKDKYDSIPMTTRELNLGDDAKSNPGFVKLK